MTSHDEVPRVVSASREIAAGPQEIFELIADPTQQPRWDGNDNLAEAFSDNIDLQYAGIPASLMSSEQRQALLEHLGVARLHAVLGSSLGGMLALEYATLFPDTVDRLIAISASGMTHPFAIALRHVQRRAIRSDPAWRGGDYYGHGTPAEGLMLAREIGTITIGRGAISPASGTRASASVASWSR